jgi:hypothetical protein
MAKALYAAYLAGISGQSIALFYIGDGVIAGIDVGLMQYDGNYSLTSDGGLDGTLEYVLPAGVGLITGAPPTAVSTRVPMKLKLPANFADGQTLTIDTPTGPVNARFERIKELPNGVP